MGSFKFENPFDGEYLVAPMREVPGSEFDVGRSGSKVNLNGHKFRPEAFWSFGTDGTRPVCPLRGGCGELCDFRAAVSIGAAETVVMFGRTDGANSMHNFLARAVNEYWPLENRFDSAMQGRIMGRGADVLYLMRNADKCDMRRLAVQLANMMFCFSYCMPDVFAAILVYAAEAYGMELLHAIEGDIQPDHNRPSFHAMKFTVSERGEEDEEISRMHYALMDGRGISLLLFALLAQDIIMLCCGDEIGEPDDYGSVFMERYRRCLCGDALSRYHDPASPVFGDMRCLPELKLNGFGHHNAVRDMDEEESHVYSLYESMGLAAYMLDGRETEQPVFRLDFMEAQFHGIDDIAYSSAITLTDTVLLFMGASAKSAQDWEKEVGELERKLEAKAAELVSARSEARGLTDRNRDLEAHIAALEKEHEAELKAMGYQLGQKKELVERLQLKLDAIENEVQGYYGDEVFEELPEAVKELDTGKMAEFLSQFRIVIVGGFLTKERQLEQLGLKGFVQINGMGDFKGTPPDADLVVVCTRFVSHKMHYHVRSLYRDQDKILMYNGVNAEKLIAVCYDCLMQKLGGYDDGKAC